MSVTEAKFIPRRLGDLMNEKLRPLGWYYVGYREAEGPTYEFVFRPTPKLEGATSITLFEIQQGKRTLKQLANQLASKLIRKVQDHND